MQTHHYCIEKLLQVKTENSRNKLYMRYPSTTFLHVWTHLPFEKVFPPKLSIRFAARELQHDWTAASCSHTCNCSNTHILTNIPKAERVDHLNQPPSQSIISSSRTVGQVFNPSDNLVRLSGRLVPALTTLTAKKKGLSHIWVEAQWISCISNCAHCFCPVTKEEWEEPSFIFLQPPFRYLYTLMRFSCSKSSVLQTEQSQPSQSLLISNVPILSASLWPFAGLPTTVLHAACSLVQISYHLSFIFCLSGWTTLKLGGHPWKTSQLSWV